MSDNVIKFDSKFYDPDKKERVNLPHIYYKHANEHDGRSTSKVYMH